MSLSGIQLTILNFSIVFLNIAGMYILKQRVPVVHFYTERIKSCLDFLRICYHRLIAVKIVRYYSKIMILKFIVKTEFNLFGVYHDKFQLRRTFAIQQ